jgi:flagellar hook protein FlgE
MGLSSALTTALTGLNAAETQIDVAGNNLANSQTVGFKASDVVFATVPLPRTTQAARIPASWASACKSWRSRRTLPRGRSK